MRLGLIHVSVGFVAYGLLCCAGCGLSRGSLLSGRPPTQSEPGLEFAAQKHDSEAKTASSDADTALGEQSEPGAAPGTSQKKSDGFLKSASGLRKVIPLRRTDLSKSNTENSSFDIMPEPGDQSEEDEAESAADGPINWNDSES